MGAGNRRRRRGESAAVCTAWASQQSLATRAHLPVFSGLACLQRVNSFTCAPKSIARAGIESRCRKRDAMQLRAHQRAPCCSSKAKDAPYPIRGPAMGAVAKGSRCGLACAPSSSISLTSATASVRLGRTTTRALLTKEPDVKQHADLPVRPLSVCIAGGGIGGLVLAVALLKKGFKVRQNPGAA